jgi:hypothetical protein
MEQSISKMSVAELDEFVKLMDTKKHEIKEKFNKFALNMCKYLGTLHPDTHFGKYKDTINEFFNSRPEEPIALFLEQVYANQTYLDNIKKGNDDFFVNADYSQHKDVHTSQIFEFKNLWTRLNSEGRDSIKKTMKLLIVCTETYLDILHNRKLANNKLKNR